MSKIEGFFEEKLTNLNISFEKKEHNVYTIDANGSAKEISLFNLEKNYIRDNDVGAIDIFIESIFQPIDELPSWAELKKGIFVSIEPSSYEGLERTIFKKLSESVVAVLSYYNSEANQIRWLESIDLDEKDVDIDTAWNQAYDNLEYIMSKTKLSFTDIDNEKLGMIEIHEPYKASLILTKGLKDRVFKDIGWPIYAVVPARDFVYVFSKDSSLINKVGSVVTKEFLQSGYPISTEVWELSDNEQKTIGAFPTE